MAESEKTKHEYSGFNLLVADKDELWWLSNRDGAAHRLEPGIYGLGNLLLDTPEIIGAKSDFEHSVSTATAIDSLFGVLEKYKIVAPEYGTRCSTVLLAHADGRMHFAERPFDASGAEGSTLRYEFSASG